MTVCSTPGQDSTATATALDSTTGRLLWQLPDKASGRIAPSVTAIWHGAVYGSTENGAVVLDARTGADRDRRQRRATGRQ